MSCLNALKLTLALLLSWAWSAGTACAQVEGIATPTPAHEVLKNDVGTWDADVSVWPNPGAEPMKSQAVETNEMLGNFWIVSRFQGTMMDQPFSGVGTVGYDPAEKKYVGTWVDSMSPSLFTMKGDYDAATKTMTMEGESRDPVNGKMVRSRNIGRYLDQNTRMFEMQMEGADGQFQKVMEIHYKRRQQ